MDSSSTLDKHSTNLTSSDFRASVELVALLKWILNGSDNAISVSLSILFGYPLTSANNLPNKNPRKQTRIRIWFGFFQMCIYTITAPLLNHIMLFRQIQAPSWISIQSTLHLRFMSRRWTGCLRLCVARTDFKSAIFEVVLLKQVSFLKRFHFGQPKLFVLYSAEVVCFLFILKLCILCLAKVVFCDVCSPISPLTTMVYLSNIDNERSRA